VSFIFDRSGYNKMVTSKLYLAIITLINCFICLFIIICIYFTTNEPCDDLCRNGGREQFTDGTGYR
jgi:TM2 domain-containing membrane protein YozV